MTKMIKMSLIAAVAVTGMTSTVCAQPLEDAIKGVDVSGMLRYRYDDTSDQKATTAGTTQTNEYTMHLNVASKVNDVVTANVKVEALGVSDISSSNAHATTDGTGDRDVTLAVTKANFSANLGVATVIAGKQSVPSPFVDNSVDDTTRGTGAVALVPAGPVTIAAGYFSNFQGNIGSTSATTPQLNLGNNISALAVLGKVADVSFDAWYVDVADAASALTIGVKAAVAGINIDARHSTLDPDAANTKDGGLTKIVASTKIGAASVVAGFATTPKDNTGATLDGDADAQSDFKVWQASVGGLNDATAFLIGAGMDVMPNLNLDAKYVMASATKSATEDLDATELLIGATYKMSKNFAVHARYSMYDVDYSKNTADVEKTKGRLEVKYTF